MAFSVELIYIEEAEKSLGLTFPPLFKAKLAKENGGEIDADDGYWKFYPVMDKLNRERIRRTSNDILHETKRAKEWNGFPINAIAIGDNDEGDLLILQTDGKHSTQLSESIYLWSHETGEVRLLATSIEVLLSSD
ncbi:SMI1/KNR4 family protein [Flavitalea sp.]|nr:SMI1/KNR4 family protein [Flavitalea sp.]